MDSLLTNQFIAHYTLIAPGVAAIPVVTNEKYFELKDDKTLIYLNPGDGVAPHSNDNALEVKVINYEAFHIQLPNAFKLGKSICDLIVYTSTVYNYFSLNELTDTIATRVIPFTDLGGNSFPGKRAKALNQLETTLALLNAIPDIKDYVNKFSVKRCCFFNKQATPPINVAPATITAPTSFGRLNTISEEGFEMSHPTIEGMGFKLFEYSGGKAAKIA